MSMAEVNDANTIQVLDKGFVSFVSHMGDDLMVVNAARVSFNKKSSFEYEVEEVPEKNGGVIRYQRGSAKLGNKDEKLITYLAKHKHWTPFAHPQITLHIKAPISIRTQLFKHKQGFVENEVSRRYVKDEPDYYIPEWRSAPTNGAKQGSEDFIQDLIVEDFDRAYNRVALDAIDTYNLLLREGVAPEQARFVLPQGTYTEWWWTGSLAAYARVYSLRSDPHAQWEVREYAAAISKLIEPLFPVSWRALTQ
jgi:thymidylate synthase (FAD)